MDVIGPGRTTTAGKAGCPLEILATSPVYRGRAAWGLEGRYRPSNIPCIGATCLPSTPRLGRTLSSGDAVTIQLALADVRSGVDNLTRP